MLKILPQVCLLFTFFNIGLSKGRVLEKRGVDTSIRGYINERTCWWNEVCKEEFQIEFRCKCPEWSFCRAPGKYYNAFCSMANTGYIWNQPVIQNKILSA